MQHVLSRANSELRPKARSIRRRLEGSLARRLRIPVQLLLCAFTLAVVVVAGWELHDEFQLTPVLLCLVSSIFLALVTDLTVAVAYSLVSACVADYFFIGPLGDIELNAHFLVRAAVFASTSLLANYLVGSLRRAYLESTAARASAEIASREKDEILGILAHDLRAPLTAVQLSIQLIERQLPPSVPCDAVLRNTKRARDACQRVNGLVVDLLDSAKAAKGGISVSRVSHDLSALLRAAIEELRVVAAQNGIALDDSGITDHLQLAIDQNRISQLISNLLGNSFKFTPRGGSVAVALAREANQVLLSVRDSGIGMTEEQRRHAFERFWQAERSNRSGVGLGLFIVKAIVDAHGGEISIESAPNQGTTVNVKLPA